MKTKNNFIINIITIFPEMFKIILKYGIIKKSIEKKILKIKCWNPRKFINDKSKNIDDKPYGGGPGMIIKPYPLYNTIEHIKNLCKKNSIQTIYMSPQGKKISKKVILNILQHKQIILVCGRYKGIDERIIIKEIDQEISIGDYVLTGGEIPAMVLIECIIRFVPGILKKKCSIEDSFFNGLLDHPNYTKPKIFKGIQVPKVLLSGNHKNIKIWKSKESLKATLLKRPDMLKKKIKYNKKEILKILGQEYKN
ncbi:tRNA (guanosine(37)-N1)-methyltransferase TrmD [Buchnera aphidicola (Chaitoregma tattakana)]|uniref:tRNA (guanosine(37)-N1)-methyltransferase TrmD n=1 Tax=Buchnera aphidicola TaxID=9 RepID=UPI0031B8A6D6